MVKAREQDRPAVVQILTEAFSDNRSVQYIIPQDARRRERIQRLMEYSFDMCMLYGEVFRTKDGNGCALVLFPDQKKTGLRTIGLDLKLVVKATGIRNALKAMKREAAVRKLQPGGPLYYLWFIGVRPEAQGKGTGRRLLAELKQQASNMNRLLCLETSVIKNISWYEKNGLGIYHELDLGYPLYFMKADETVQKLP